jgi:hypothetical protein
MRKATTKRDTAVSKKKTAMSNLVTKASAHKKVMKELSDAKKELANAKKEVENLTRQLQQADFQLSRGDSVISYSKKERIKPAVFEEKTAISRQNKEKEDQRKTDAKHNNVNTSQLTGSRDNPYLQRGGTVAAGSIQEIRIGAIVIVAAKAGVTAAVRAGIILSKSSSQPQSQ